MLINHRPVGIIALALFIFAVIAAPSTNVRPASADVPIVINEVESNPSPDWVELYNPNPTPVDIGGYGFRDNDGTHAIYRIPAGTMIAANGYFVIEEATFGFGLGAADSAILYASGSTTVVDQYDWTSHATSTFARCPNGSGAFSNATTTTKGAVNDCSIGVKINEVESNPSPDWVEFINTSGVQVDLSGYIFKDSGATGYVLPAGSTIAPGGYLVIEETLNFTFGLGAADSARLFAPDGTTLVDSHSWTSHAITTLGRCPNGTGVLDTTISATKGAANDCPGNVPAEAWPGDAAVQTADAANVLGGDMSGLTYEASGSTTPGVLWAVRNGTGTLFRLVWDGGFWTPDPANGWSAGKMLKYAGNVGRPDSEGLTFAGGGSAAGVYVSTERDNDNNGVSRNSILRFDPAAAGATLIATNEWNLTSLLPVVGANLGLEAVTWVPDAYLVLQGFVDESTGQLYNPAGYANHGDGLFFVGVEGTGKVYAFALNHTTNTGSLVATVSTGFAGVMALEFDPELHNFWVVCDDGCNGRSALLEVNAQGRFLPARVFERPGTMPNLNNEGFAMAPQAECVNDRKPVFWTDDGNTGSHALRSGTVSCSLYPDADGDGIEDSVDAGDSTFSDAPLGGITAGSFDANGRDIMLTDLVAGGVRVVVGPGGGDPAEVEIDGKQASIALTEGAFEITDPAQIVTVTALDGTAVIEFTQNGTTITIVVPEGESVTYAEENGKITILEQSDGVDIGAGDLGAGSCGDIAIENFIFGTSSNETINGTAANDLILAKGGNNTVNGNGGNDCIISAGGNDKITTGNGNDFIDAGSGNNTINAGGGNNTVATGGGNDTISTEDGNDTIDAGSGNNKIAAGAGTNVVTTGGGNDEVTTGNGDDTINAGSGNNKISTGNGTNLITTAGGNDDITTGNDNDTIDAGSGNNKVNAGDGTNTVTTAGGNDEITTGGGSDTVSAGSGNNKISTGGGADGITTAGGNDNVDCGDGVDSAHVGSGNNSNAGGRCETFAK